MWTSFMTFVLRTALILVLGLTVAGGGATPAIAQTIPTQTIPGKTLDLTELEQLNDRALRAANTGDFATSESYWTQLIEQLPDNPALWSNRGNTRVSQNHLNEAIADYDRAIALAPDLPDAYLNRGAAYEGLKRWTEAIADYDRVLELSPQDAAAYNNRGNARAGLGDWETAIADYQKAAELEPNFAFARANALLARYQTGDTETATRQMKTLVRKYPQFADMRAALTAALWKQGNIGEAESNWVAAIGLDSRYKEIDWVRDIRRWPPGMVEALDRFLQLKG